MRTTNELESEFTGFGQRKVLRFLIVRYVIIGLHLFGEYTVRQLMALAGRGHQIVYITARTRRSCMKIRHVRGFRLDPVLLRKVVPILSLIFFELVVCWRILKSIRRYDVLIVDIYSVPLIFPYVLFYRLWNRYPALFLRVESNPVETGGHLRTLGVSFLYALSIKIASAFFDGAFFISPMLGQQYSDQFGIPASKVGTWPSSVDMPVFDPKRVKHVDRLREELGLSEHLAVLYHGVLTKGRGTLEILEAFRILRDESVKATLVLLGYGDKMKEQVYRYITSNDLGKVVRLCGPVDYDQVPKYIAACDVGINSIPDRPWWRYQCFIKVLECLAMNKPLIVSDIPAHRWMIGNAPVAVYLRGTSPREIADGVIAFLRIRESLVPGIGRQLASGFSAERVAEDLESQMMSMIAKSVSPSSPAVSRSKSPPSCHASFLGRVTIEE